jgi:uncharacterized BrkB/YihY/UPF0761 family membrane protein
MGTVIGLVLWSVFGGAVLFIGGVWLERSKARLHERIARDRELLAARRRLRADKLRERLSSSG